MISLPRCRLLAILFGGMALSACSHTVQQAGSPGTLPAPEAAIPHEYEQVVAALEHGDTKTAQRLLRDIRKHDPNSARARLLAETIDIDPVAMLGSRSFAYKLKSGDTLHDLAGRYLDDPDKFYALARYNHIDDPSAVTPGQTIRIPGAAPAEQMPPERVEHPVARPEPRTAPQPAKPAPSARATNPALAARYRAAGLHALANGAVDKAVGDLSRAAALDPTNPLIKRDLDRAQRIRRTVQARKAK